MCEWPVQSTLQVNQVVTVNISAETTWKLFSLSMECSPDADCRRVIRDSSAVKPICETMAAERSILDCAWELHVRY